MKSLANSSSVAIAEKLRSSSPRPSIHASDRPEFCFSLRCRNVKSGNFPFLKLVQNKGVSPVHALPSKTQVDLDTVELPVQQHDEMKFVRIKFQLQKHCKFGEQFFIVGDDPMFGSWDPEDAIPMAWSDGHIWTADMDIEAGKTIQFKFILKGRSGNITWQPGYDRNIHTWETVNRITVCEDWENADLQKIIEEEQHSHSDEEEPQIIEKPMSSPMEKPMSTVAENIVSSMKSTSRRKVRKNTTRRNDPIAHELGHGNGKAAAMKNQERNLFDFEGGPVIVAGLAPSIVPNDEESTAGEEVEERITMDNSVGALETKGQNKPEEQEYDDGTPSGISETTNNEAELLDIEHEKKLQLAPIMEEISDSQPIDEPVEEVSLKQIMSSVIVLIHLPKFLLAWQRWKGGIDDKKG